ncbi:hypothetical protein BAMA_08750 [Bacillus manliponensis]|uniref:Permease n=1 Tax=Bacillus manliponensis TaxID=574376 RepID=A0A073K343_9BACI|nr:YoqO family protein [Bacillus manliponensis]KEK20872.1 hypothetical protein BAMA_08750 [Bacillus manliponensis]
MKEKIGFYGFMICCLLSIFFNDYIPDVWNMFILTAALVFGILFRWKSLRELSLKRKVIYSIEFVVCVPILALIIVQGGEGISKLGISHGWVSFLYIVYMIVVFCIASVFITKLNEKLFMDAK